MPSPGLPSRLVDIRPIDPHRSDETGYPAAYAVFREAVLAGRPWATVPSADEVLAQLRHDDPTEIGQWFAAFDGDRVVGAAQAWLPLTDNVHMAWLGIEVAPADRRKGVGTALAHHLADFAHDHQRTLLLSEVETPPDAGQDHPYRAFYRSVGFEHANTEISRHLELPVAEELLTRLLDDAKPHYEGAYTIEVHTDGIPDDLLPSYCTAFNRLITDAPSGSVDFEEMSLTPDLFRSYLELDRKVNAQRLSALALTADREVAAFSDLFLPASNPDRAHQWGTLVTAPHRGHRLGTAVKVANLQELQRRHPDRRIVRTGNAETNKYMVSINEALGFRMIEIMDSIKRDDSTGS
jgi:GNAT superfamily N-acetyltransferase